MGISPGGALSVDTLYHAGCKGLTDLVGIYAFYSHF